MSGKTEVREVRNMTEGNPAKLIFFFAIPLMLGNLFQQVYTITAVSYTHLTLPTNSRV